MTLWQFSANDAAEAIRGGQFSSQELISACMEHIDATDPEIGAWAILNREGAPQEAAAMDDLRRRGRPVGPLHGVPVGVSGDFESEQPREANAAIVDRLHEAGAVVIGKTVTADITSTDHSEVRNPHNKAHSAGSVSAGSAAVVANAHVALGVGIDTDGSLIEAASYCGVYGFKPTRGIISRRGAAHASQTLSQIGLFSRTLPDIALLADALAGFDPADKASFVRPKPQMLAGCRAEAPVEPCFAWFDMPAHEQLSSAMRDGLNELIEVLGDRVERVPIQPAFAEAIKCHQMIAARELQQDPGGDAATIGEEDYRGALAMLADAQGYFDAFFKDFDAIIAPSAFGEAPEFGKAAGSSGCSTMWALAGLPCLSLPMLQGASGLPAGVQLIGPAELDDRLLRTASWLESHLAAVD